MHLPKSNSQTIYRCYYCKNMSECGVVGCDALLRWCEKWEEMEYIDVTEEMEEWGEFECESTQVVEINYGR